MMRTTVNLDPELLAEIIEDTGEGNRGRALNKVLSEYLRRRKIDQLLALRGKLDIRDEWEKWEEEELEDMKRHDDYRGR
jgi:metal-responsive CopG/Arc/MetJ family transcriptional regulator